MTNCSSSIYGRAKHSQRLSCWRRKCKNWRDYISAR